MLASASGPLGTVATSGCREVASEPQAAGRARGPRPPPGQRSHRLCPPGLQTVFLSQRRVVCHFPFRWSCVCPPARALFWTTGQWLEAGSRRRIGHPLPRRPQPRCCCSVCPVASFKGKLVSPGAGPSLGPLSVPPFPRPRLSKECGPSVLRMTPFRAVPVGCRSLTVGLRLCVVGSGTVYGRSVVRRAPCPPGGDPGPPRPLGGASLLREDHASACAQAQCRGGRRAPCAAPGTRPLVCASVASSPRSDSRDGAAPLSLLRFSGGVPQEGPFLSPRCSLPCLPCFCASSPCLSARPGCAG